MSPSPLLECPDCGGPMDSRAGHCMNCRQKPRATCIDCGKPVSHGAERCRSCLWIPCPTCEGTMKRDFTACVKCRRVADLEKRLAAAGDPLDQPFPLGGWSRAAYGIIVSFENETGGRLTLHREGSPIDGIKQACKIALAKDETYRVVCMSSPETIYTDLQGKRGVTDPISGHGRPKIPEPNKVPRAMIHPRLLTGDRHR